MKKIILSFAVLSLLSCIALAADSDNPKDVNANPTKSTVVKVKTKHHKNIAKNYDSRTAMLEQEVQQLNHEVSLLRNVKYIQPSPNRGNLWIDYFRQHGPMVVTSPLVPVVSKEDGSDLYINMPSVNEDYALLAARQNMENFYAKYGITQDRPVVVLSGDLEGWVQYDRDYFDPTNISTTLASADLEVILEVNSWVSGLVLVSYNNLTIDYIVGQISNLLYLNRGYIVFGNMNKFPAYFTIGQFYVPFGDYANYMITTPLTQALGRIKARAISAGFKFGYFYGAVFGFNGASFVSNSSTLNNGGADLGFKYQKDKLTFELGAGYIVNLADSDAMQNTPGVSYSSQIDQFLGFHFNEATEQISNEIPAGDVHVSFTYDPFTILAEYVGSLKAFDVADNSLLFNGSGAKMAAFDAEAVYNFNFYTKPSFISAGYGRTWEALILNLPEQSIFVSLSSSLLKSTREAIEYRHDINYSSSDTARGTSSQAPASPFHPLGRQNRDLITLSLKFYF